MDNLLEKIITVNSVTNLNPTDPKPINFKDENGNKYVLWKTKSDKTMSLAYQMFQSLPYGGDGATIGISYVEQPSSFVNKEGKEISFTQRVVRVVKKPNEVKPSNQVPNYPSKTAPVATQAPMTEVDWEKVSMGKCKHAYLVEAFKAHLGNPNVKLSEIEKIAEEWAKASMRILPANTARIDSGSITVATPTYTTNTTNTVTSPAVAQSLEQSLASQGVEIPPMPEEDEISVENIPF
jgi:hypothetical protein